MESATKNGVKGLKDECARVEAAASTDQAARYEQARVHRYLRHRRISDVEGVLEMRGPIDETARVMAALEPRERTLFKAARAAGRREEPEALAFDAMAELADDSAAARFEEFPSRAPATLVVRVDHRAFERGETEAGEVCEIVGVGPVPVFVAQKLAADSVMKALIHDGTDVLAVSHLGRTIPARLAHGAGRAVPGMRDRGMSRESPSRDRPQHAGQRTRPDRALEPLSVVPVPSRPQAPTSGTRRRRRHQPKTRPGRRPTTARTTDADEEARGVIPGRG